MASRYHWLTAGIDSQFALALPTAQALPISLPAGAQMKRFMVRQAWFNATNNVVGKGGAFGIQVAWDIHFTSGPNNGRHIFQTARDVPFTPVMFVPITGGNNFCWWHAGDNELGFNQKSIYGTSAGGAENLQCSYSFHTDRFPDMSNMFGEFSFVFAVLYYL